jgi:cyclopropane fatty-acyl-phospholipid synthase-like methyltransferase
LFLRKTRAIWKRRAQGWFFDHSGMQAMLDERERHALEDMMGFRGQWDEHQRFQIDELKKLGLKPGSSVLEIGCGPLTAGLPVIEYLDVGRYVGVDVRSNVLNLSWQQIGKNGLSAKNPRLLRADDFGAAELAGRKFDFVWSFSVLYHLTDEILENLFSNVGRRLEKDGSFAANVMTNMEDSTWLEFPFRRRTIDTYGSLAMKHGLKMTNLGTIEERGFRLSGDERKNSLLQFQLA